MIANSYPIRNLELFKEDEEVFEEIIANECLELSEANIMFLSDERLDALLEGRTLSRGEFETILGLDDKYAISKQKHIFDEIVKYREYLDEEILARFLNYLKNGEYHISLDVLVEFVSSCDAEDVIKTLLHAPYSEETESYNLVLNALAEPYNNICNTSKRDKLSYTKLNRELLNRVLDLNIISSYREEKDGLRVYHKHKNVGD